MIIKRTLGTRIGATIGPDMFEYHGWISIRDADRTDKFGDRENEPLGSTIAAIGSLIEADRVTTRETFTDPHGELVPAGASETVSSGTRTASGTSSWTAIETTGRSGYLRSSAKSGN